MTPDDSLIPDPFTRDDGTWTAFICTCSEEGIIKAGRLRREVRRLLAGGSLHLAPRPVRASNFLTMAVISLNWDFSGYITKIANDMWSKVNAESWDKENPFRVRVQCDEVEDGIAAAWYAFWLRKHEADRG